MNRNFPGNPSGWLSEQIAHVLATKFVEQRSRTSICTPAASNPTVDYVYIFDRSRELSLAFGRPLMFERAQPYQGSSIPAARRAFRSSPRSRRRSFLEYALHRARGARRAEVLRNSR